jgi:soluble lytic murein transglycosylase-like protein
MKKAPMIVLTAFLLLWGLNMPPVTIELSAATQTVYKTLREKYIAEFSAEFGIDPILMSAIVAHESMNFPRAERNDRARLEGVRWVEDVIKTHGLDRENPEIWHSMGYGQVLYLTAVDMGFLGWCKGRGLNPHPASLLDIETNIYWMAKYISKRLMNRYKNPKDIMAGYNAGSARKDSKGRYINQSYVDSVMKHYIRLGGKL